VVGIVEKCDSQIRRSKGWSFLRPFSVLRRMVLKKARVVLKKAHVVLKKARMVLKKGCQHGQIK
jgi:hypothetical protein